MASSISLLFEMFFQTLIGSKFSKKKNKKSREVVGGALHQDKEDTEHSGAVSFSFLA